MRSEPPTSLHELGAVFPASPCRSQWSAMAGDATQRTCSTCRKNVYDLSSVDALSARDHLLKSEGVLCVRFYVRTDGKALTQDCPAGSRDRRRRRGAIVFAAMAAALVWGTVGLKRFGYLDRFSSVDDPYKDNPTYSGKTTITNADGQTYEVLIMRAPPDNNAY